MNEDLSLEQFAAPVNVPVHAYVSRETPNDELILLLHGYGQTSVEFVKQLADSLKGHSICALQAPFPVPIKGSEGWRIGYSWYAYDAATDSFQIPISSGVGFAKYALERLQVATKISRVIGFSQGGYFAPFIAAALPGVKQVIGINSRYKNEDLPDHGISFRVDAINGENDRLVDPKKARLSHDDLLKRGFTGTFVLLPNASHELSPNVCEAVKECLGFL